MREPGPRNVVVTGGGTIAPIDDVRHIANSSTGRFSSEIAEACLARGAHVWHIHSPHAIRPFDRASRLDLDHPDPASELRRLAELADRYRACRDRLHLVPLPSGTLDEYARALEGVLRDVRIDVAFLAMAASDYQPEPQPGKLDSNQAELIVRCHPARKVIRSVRDWAPEIYLVGFKLLSGASEEELIRVAEKSCHTNRADLTVANDLRLLRDGRHTVHLVRPGHEAETLGPGGRIAESVADRVLALAALRGSRP